MEELTDVRSQIIKAAVGAFQPDLLIVDNVPRGAGRELDPLLDSLHRDRRTRIVLGLRDILDAPEIVRQQWTRDANLESIRRHYDEIWIYGDPAIYNPAQEYGFPADIAARVRFTGYLDQRRRLAFAPLQDVSPLNGLDLPTGKLVLCLVGGGQDGAHVAEAFARAGLPTSVTGVTLTGPHIPVEVRQRLHAWSQGDPHRRVVEFLPEPGLLWARANRVITMGGYNSISDVLSYGKPALVVPRVQPRREQIIRAERLRDLGQLDMMHPDAVSPRALTDWLARPATVPVVERGIDLGGLDRLPSLVQSTLAAAPVTLHDGSGILDLEVTHAAS